VEVAIVTGGSRGIGAATAVELAHRDKKVLISFQERRRHAEEVLQRIRDLGGEGDLFIGDISKPEVARGLVERATTLGELTVVVNCAGVYHPRSLPSLSPSLIEDMVATNLLGPLLVMHEALQVMRRGVIVNISSVVGLSPSPGMSVYSVTKNALALATKLVAEEAGDVRIVCVAPGPTDTEMLRRYHPYMPADPPEKVAERIMWVIDNGVSGKCYTVP